MHLTADFEVITLPPDQPMIGPEDKKLIEVRPTKLFIHPKGAKDDTPSFTWYMETVNPDFIVVAQITKTMLLEGLSRAGVKL